MSVFDRQLTFISAASRTERAPGVEEELTLEELAFWLRRSDKFVRGMKRWGWAMRFDTLQRREFGTLKSALEWLDAHPDYRVNKDPPARNSKKRA